MVENSRLQVQLIHYMVIQRVKQANLTLTVTRLRLRYAPQKLAKNGYNKPVEFCQIGEQVMYSLGRWVSIIV